VILKRPLRFGGRMMTQWTQWFSVAAGVMTLGALGAWYLATRPILYTRLFVSRDERPLVRREILGNPSFGRRMRLIGTVLLLLGLACLAAAFVMR